MATGFLEVGQGWIDTPILVLFFFISLVEIQRVQVAGQERKRGAKSDRKENFTSYTNRLYRESIFDT